MGYRVTAVHGSVEAWERFQLGSGLYDIVVTDQVMPGLTGAELARRMLELRPSLPIILVTGYGNDLTPERAAEIGIREYLTKPISNQRLGEALRRVLSQSARA
jgi:CheY-like chemotaxis protein